MATETQASFPDLYITIPETQEQMLKQLLVENAEHGCDTPAFGGCPKCGGLAKHTLTLLPETRVVYHRAKCLWCDWKDPVDLELWDPEINYSERFGLFPPEIPD